MDVEKYPHGFKPMSPPANVRPSTLPSAHIGDACAATLLGEQTAPSTGLRRGRYGDRGFPPSPAERHDTAYPRRSASVSVAASNGPQPSHSRMHCEPPNPPMLSASIPNSFSASGHCSSRFSSSAAKPARPFVEPCETAVVVRIDRRISVHEPVPLRNRHSSAWIAGPFKTASVPARATCHALRDRMQGFAAERTPPEHFFRPSMLCHSVAIAYDRPRGCNGSR